MGGLGDPPRASDLPRAVGRIPVIACFRTRESGIPVMVCPRTRESGAGCGSRTFFADQARLSPFADRVRFSPLLWYAGRIDCFRAFLPASDRFGCSACSMEPEASGGRNCSSVLWNCPAGAVSRQDARMMHPSAACVSEACVHPSGREAKMCPGAGRLKAETSFPGETAGQP